MRLPVNQVLPLAALLLMAGVGALQATAAEPASSPSGPAADYPVTVGDPYTIGGTTWTPSDQLNYDAVGYAGAQDGLVGVSAAHKTLPLPSYAEVTALDTGKTILVRIVERGPMVNETLIALSPQAATQLGLAPGGRTPVRVRRVNPPEIERAALRNGSVAPMRMETPDSLLKVLRRKLADQSPLVPPPSTPPAMPTSLEVAKVLPNAPVPTPKATMTPAIPSRPASQPQSPSPKPVDGPKAAKPQSPAAAPTAARPVTERGSHIVQVAAFSSRERAEKAAKQFGGQVSPVGKLWRVRLGPFKSGGEASSALEKAKAAGYSDARIQRAD